jgi:hypothetical protein
MSTTRLYRGYVNWGLRTHIIVTQDSKSPAMLPTQHLDPSI